MGTHRLRPAGGVGKRIRSRCRARAPSAASDTPADSPARKPSQRQRKRRASTASADGAPAAAAGQRMGGEPGLEAAGKQRPETPAVRASGGPAATSDSCALEASEAGAGPLVDCRSSAGVASPSSESDLVAVAAAAACEDSAIAGFAPSPFFVPCGSPAARPPAQQHCGLAAARGASVSHGWSSSPANSAGTCADLSTAVARGGGYCGVGGGGVQIAPAAALTGLPFGEPLLPPAFSGCLEPASDATATPLQFVPQEHSSRCSPAATAGAPLAAAAGQRWAAEQEEMLKQRVLHDRQLREQLQERLLLLQRRQQRERLLQELVQEQQMQALQQRQLLKQQARLRAVQLQQQQMHQQSVALQQTAPAAWGAPWPAAAPAAPAAKPEAGFKSEPAAACAVQADGIFDVSLPAGLMASPLDGDFLCVGAEGDGDADGEIAGLLREDERPLSLDDPIGMDWDTVMI
jgi:hypothetical protein